MDINTVLASETLRQRMFPVTTQGIYLSHAAVCPLPQVAADAINAFTAMGSHGNQENAYTEATLDEARAFSARLLGATPSEIALLGPTSLGLNLVAHGLPWQPGDEVIFHADDYPANVYPWRALERLGVRPVALHPAVPGRIDWALVEAALTPRTRLVSLATCHYLTGCRIPVDDIGWRLKERGVLFCLDAIQTLGAFPLHTRFVDFLSADSHKWLLGPAGAGIFYVRAERQEQLTPSLLGSWNVHSPGFIAQETIAFEPGARRYEPGTMNLPGICGMAASMKLLLDFDVEAIAAWLLLLQTHLVEGARKCGYRIYPDDEPGCSPTPEEARSGIATIYHPERDLTEVHTRLKDRGVTVSLRANRAGRAMLRFSPHVYNTTGEIDVALGLL
jgi:cysteine desulfurase/selenocysteine lyase